VVKSRLDSATKLGDFLAALHVDCKGLIELRALPSAARAFTQLGDDHAVARFADAHTNENVFIGIATRRNESGGKLENCRHLGALFADIDFKVTPEREARQRLARFVFPPSAVVHSGGGLHVYWWLREPIELPDEAAHAKQLLRRLAAAVGGDLSSAEPAHVLRVPGTRNHKYGPPPLVRIEDLDAAL
jgi:hypothetical protein